MIKEASGLADVLKLKAGLFADVVYVGFHGNVQVKLYLKTADYCFCGAVIFWVYKTRFSFLLLFILSECLLTHA